MPKAKLPSHLSALQGERVGAREKGRVYAPAPDELSKNAKCSINGLYDPDMWFADDIETQLTAQAICDVCPVFDLCRKAGYEKENLHPDAGIYAGETAEERAEKAGFTSWFDMRAERYIELQTVGMTNAQIAKEYALDVAQVDRAISSYRKRKGMAPRYNSPAYAEEQAKRNEEMSDLKAQGWTYQQIGEKYGMTKGRAHQIIAGYRRSSSKGVRGISNV